MDQKWLEENPLTEETILSYFALSPFYDRSCLNEILKMQTQFSNLFDINEKLKSINGLRYNISNKNDIFYIFKIDKKKDSEKILDFFYVMFGRIFKGTSYNSVIKSRFNNFLFFLEKSIDSFYKERIFDPFDGFKIKFDEEVEKKDEEEKLIEEYILNEIQSKNKT